MPQRIVLYSTENNNYFFETSRIIEINWKKMRLDIMYYWEFFQRYEIDFGLIVKSFWGGTAYLTIVEISL